MTDFGRVPKMDIEESPKKAEEKIFDKPKENVSMKVSEPEPDKKLKLKEHLAKCRVKSIEVRKANKEAKLLNKKPRGRPKKNTEAQLQPVPNIDSLPEPVMEEVQEPIKEEEVFKNEVVEKPSGYKNTNTSQSINIDDLWGKLSNKMDEKFKSFSTPKAEPQLELQPPPPQDNFIKYYDEMKQREQTIREDERNKLKAEAQLHKQNIITGATNKYFNKVGYSTPQRSQPEATTDHNSEWDNLLNPRRKY